MVTAPEEEIPTLVETPVTPEVAAEIAEETGSDPVEAAPPAVDEACR